MRSFFLVLNLLAAIPLGAQESKTIPCKTCIHESSVPVKGTLPSFQCSQCVKLRELPPNIGEDDWPIDTLYNIMVALMGKEKAAERINKGFQNLEKNFYRRIYIEKGLFLLPLYPADDPMSKELDHMIMIPKDPGSDPLIIYMKDAHKKGENAAGMMNAIREALKEGDENLVYLAGRTLFDSKFTQKDWSLEVAESKFGKKPYFYKIDQRNFFTKWKLEGGVGDAIQLGGKPYYVGGSLGAKAEVDASVRQFTDIGSIKRKVVPTAKAGFWGKLAKRTSFGLSALQSYNLFGDKNGPGQFFSTEFRLGVFHAGKDGSSWGAMLHYTRSGEKIFSKDGQSGGFQGSYSPPSGWATFSASIDLAEGEDKRLNKTVYLQFVPQPRKELDITVLAMETVGYRPPGEGEFMEGKKWKAFQKNAELLLKRSREALDYIGGLGQDSKERKEVSAKEVVQFLRAQSLKSIRHMTLDISSTSTPSFVGISPGGLLAAATSMELWQIYGLRDKEALEDGWNLAGDIKAKDGDKLAKEIFEEAGRAGTEEESRRLQEILLIHAADLRRRADHSAMQTAFLLKTVAEQCLMGVNGTSSIWEGKAIWNSISRMNKGRMEMLKRILEEANIRMAHDFKLEARRYNAQMKLYGQKILKESVSSKQWPASVIVSVQEEAWVPLLADHGEDFFRAVLGRIQQAGENLKEGEKLPVEIQFLPIEGQIRIMPHRPFLIQLGMLPEKGASDVMERFWTQLDEALPK